MDMNEQLAQAIARNVDAALSEDIGSGDLTALLTPAGHPARGIVVSREAAVLCGSAWFDACFHRLDARARIRWHARDGDRIDAGQTLCEIEADTHALLTAERPALNFLQLLSGTATVTRSYVEAIAGTQARIVDTRKTLPGLRLAQKYAVRCGGGTNHRIGLFDAVLIKENHIATAGSIAAAIANARTVAGDRMVEIEVENLREFGDALAARPDRIMLDELSDEDVRTAVRRNAGQVELELSGGVSFERLAETAELGVDFVSVGALTKHVLAVDLSLRVLRRW